MIKEKYKNIPESEFVPLKEGIDPVFWGKYEINKNGEIRHVINGIRSPYRNGNYYTINLYSGKTFSYDYRVNILVAKTFIINDDPINNTLVDHINHDTLNNNVFNLRWIDPSGNRFNLSLVMIQTRVLLGLQ